MIASVECAARFGALGALPPCSSTADVLAPVVTHTGHCSGDTTMPELDDGLLSCTLLRRLRPNVALTLLFAKDPKSPYGDTDQKPYYQVPEP